MSTFRYSRHARTRVPPRCRSSRYNPIISRNTPVSISLPPLQPPTLPQVAAKRTSFIVVLGMARGSIRPRYHCKRHKRSNFRWRNKGHGRGRAMEASVDFLEFDQECFSTSSHFSRYNSAVTIIPRDTRAKGGKGGDGTLKACRSS